MPILMYHYIRINPTATDRVGADLSVSPANFGAQMDYLEQLGAHTITPSQLLAALDTGAPLPSHPVLITFDDGYEDFATVAEPILRAHGFVAVDYVVTGFIGRPGYMTAAQVMAMDRSGMIIGAHTVDHLALADLSSADQLFETSTSQRQLLALLGHPAVDFAYPYGSYSATTISILALAGFRDAVTTHSGATQVQGSSLTWPRVRVSGSDSVTSVAGKALLPLTSPYRPRLLTATPTPTATSTPTARPTGSPTPTPRPRARAARLQNSNGADSTEDHGPRKI